MILYTYIVQCTLYSIQCTLYTMYTVHNVHCTLCNVHCTLYNVHCTLYSDSSHILYTVHCSRPTPLRSQQENENNIYQNNEGILHELPVNISSTRVTPPFSASLQLTYYSKTLFMMLTTCMLDKTSLTWQPFSRRSRKSIY